MRAQLAERRGWVTIAKVAGVVANVVSFSVTNEREDAFLTDKEKGEKIEWILGFQETEEIVEGTIANVAKCIADVA